MSELATWLGIGFCVSQSAMFSGLNLAVFSVSRLELEMEVQAGSRSAQRVRRLRADSNFTLTTILWGNVGINVLLTLLSDSVLAGLMAFFFSTFVITLFGEIAPQAYFSRHAMQMAALLTPVLQLYQLVLYPVARPSALLLDAWLGKEAIPYYREEQVRAFILQHLQAEESEMELTEAIGALNFLSIDDLATENEGVPVDPESVIPLPLEDNKLVFPDFSESKNDAFLRSVERSGKSWVVLTDPDSNPRLVMDVNGFLRNAMFRHEKTNPRSYCHRPVIVRDRHRSLGEVITRLSLNPKIDDDQVISRDVILLWDAAPRIITGRDLLGRLLDGIVRGHRPKAAARPDLPG